MNKTIEELKQLSDEDIKEYVYKRIAGIEDHWLLWQITRFIVCMIGQED